MLVEPTQEALQAEGEFFGQRTGDELRYGGGVGVVLGVDEARKGLCFKDRGNCAGWFGLHGKAEYVVSECGSGTDGYVRGEPSIEEHGEECFAEGQCVLPDGDGFGKEGCGTPVT